MHRPADNVRISDLVLPIRVGMVRLRLLALPLPIRYPHTGGSGPQSMITGLVRYPNTRGDGPPFAGAWMSLKLLSGLDIQAPLSHWRGGLDPVSMQG